LGVPPEQISLGIPTYGRWFGLADGNQNTIGSPTIGSSMPVAYSDVNFLFFLEDLIFNHLIILDL
jgi:GH18 family chitinase